MDNVLILSSLLLWVIVLINLLLTLALVRRVNTPAGERIQTLSLGQNAPDFSAMTINGEHVTLADYRGRAIALVFISPTCGHCRPLIPMLETLSPKARQSGTELILVSNADITQTQTYVQELDITLPVLSAPRQKNRFLSDYKADGVPFCAVIDSQGKIRASGLLDDPHWKEILEKWERGIEPTWQSLDT